MGCNENGAEREVHSSRGLSLKRNSYTNSLTLLSMSLEKKDKLDTGPEGEVNPD